MGKLVPILIIVALVWLIFFHRSIPRFGRRAGRQVRDLKDAGKELIDNEEVPGSPLARYEAQAGKAAAARILLRHPLSGDLRLQERIARVGARLAEVSSRREVRFRFAVIDSDEPAAMSIPGGSIFITRPLVELCGGDDHRLAGVLGHEVAHIDCRHAVKQYTTRAVTRTGVRLLSLGRGALISRLVGGIEEFVVQGYSRDRELEADRRGTELAARVGYDPRALARLLCELEERDASTPILLHPFFKSHPPIPERVGALEAQWRGRESRRLEGRAPGDGGDRGRG